jgi:hypothetical protein
MDTSERLEPYFRALRSQVPPDEDLSVRIMRRQRMLIALRERVLDEHARRQRSAWWRRLGFGALVLGTSAAAVLVAIRPDKSHAPASVAVVVPAEVGVAVTVGTLTVEHQGGRRNVAAGQGTAVGSDDALATIPGGQAQLRLADVAAVTLAQDTRLTEIGGPTGHVDRVRLARGSMHLKVNKLAANQRFHVVTPDADVQVHGTEFDVNLMAEPKPHTCVRVQEGLVQVTATTGRHMIGAGESWGCDEQKAVVQALETSPELIPPPRADRRPRTAKELNDLRIQNALFQRALRAERSGDLSTANTTYRGLLKRFPAGPLSAQARTNLSALGTHQP